MRERSIWLPEVSSMKCCLHSTSCCTASHRARSSEQSVSTSERLAPPCLPEQIPRHILPATRLHNELKRLCRSGHVRTPTASRNYAGSGLSGSPVCPHSPTREPSERRQIPNRYIVPSPSAAAPQNWPGHKCEPSVLRQLAASLRQGALQMSEPDWKAVPHLKSPPTIALLQGRNAPN